MKLSLFSKSIKRQETENNKTFYNKVKLSEKMKNFSTQRSTYVVGNKNFSRHLRN